MTFWWIIALRLTLGMMSVPVAAFGLALHAQPFAPLVLGSLKNTFFLIVVVCLNIIFL